MELTTTPMTTTTPTTTTTRVTTETRYDPVAAPTIPSEDPTMTITSDAAALREPRAPDSTSPPGATATTPAARCADGHGTLVGLFFSDNVVDIARAKAMCARCPLQASCLAGALEREEPWGVWGGELLSGGRIVANKRACGRPPKHPRPPLLVDELGPVDAAAVRDADSVIAVA